MTRHQVGINREGGHMSEQHFPSPAVTASEAIAHATRLLAQAELELTNLPLIERLDQLACSWLAVANLLNERERV